MILEGLVTSVSAQGLFNLAPMGPTVPDGGPIAHLILRPFRSSRTYTNLCETRQGVFHTSDDVLLLAQATLGLARPATVPARVIAGQRLADCCAAFEFRVLDIEHADQSRPILHADVVHCDELRRFLGFNRAKNAVVEAAILASRVGILETAHILAELERLQPLIEKTGGKSEAEAFELLRAHVESGANHV